MYKNKRIDDLEKQIRSLEQQKCLLKKEWEEKTERISAIERAENAKKRGNKPLISAFVVLIAVSLGLALLMCTGELQFDAYNLGVSGYIVCACSLPLFIVGICLKRSGMRQYRAGKKLLEGTSVKKLSDEINEIEQQEEKLEKEISAAKRELKGKYWEVKEFKATPSNIREMEQDLEKLFRYLEDVRDPNEAISNWMCRTSMEFFTAVLGNDEDTTEALKAGYNELGNAGSWKLEIASWVLAYLDVVVASASFGGETKEGLDWLVGKSETFRKPETEEEEQFYRLAQNACDTMKDGLEFVLHRRMQEALSRM